MIFISENSLQFPRDDESSKSFFLLVYKIQNAKETRISISINVSSKLLSEFKFKDEKNRGIISKNRI